MMGRCASAVTAAFLVSGLAACSGPSGSDDNSSRAGGAGSSAASTSSSQASPASDIQASLDKFVATLDQLGIQHGTPTRTDVGLSGAKAVFDVTVDGYDAGINVFPDAEALTRWQKASDSFGGVDVTVGNAALSLNSSDGIQDSAKIAPKIAQAVGGEAHGV